MPSIDLLAINAIDALIESQCRWDPSPAISHAQAVASGPAQFNLAALLDSVNSSQCFIEHQTQLTSSRPPSIILQLDYLKQRAHKQAIHPLEIMSIKRLFKYARERGMAIFLWQANAPHKKPVYSDDDVWSHLKNSEPETCMTPDQINAILAHTGESASSYRLVFNVSITAAYKRNQSKSQQELKLLMHHFGSFPPTFSWLPTTYTADCIQTLPDDVSISAMLPTQHQYDASQLRVKMHGKKRLRLQSYSVKEAVFPGAGLFHFPVAQNTPLINAGLHSFYTLRNRDSVADRQARDGFVFLTMKNGYHRVDYVNDKQKLLKINPFYVNQLRKTLASLPSIEKIYFMPEIPSSSFLVSKDRLTSVETCVRPKTLYALKIDILATKLHNFHFTAFVALLELKLKLILSESLCADIEADLRCLSQLKKLTLENSGHETIDLINLILPTQLTSLRIKADLLDRYITTLVSIKNLEELSVSGKASQNFFATLSDLPNLTFLSITLHSLTEEMTLDLSDHQHLTTLTLQVQSQDATRPINIILPNSVKRLSLDGCFHFSINGATSQIEELFFAKIPSDLTFCEEQFPNLTLLSLNQLPGKICLNLQTTMPDIIYANTTLTFARGHHLDSIININPLCQHSNLTASHSLEESHAPAEYEASRSVSSAPPTTEVNDLIVSVDLNQSLPIQRKMNGKITLPDDPEYMAAFFNSEGTMALARTLRVAVYSQLIDGQLHQDDSSRYNISSKHYLLNEKQFGELALQPGFYRGKLHIKKRTDLAYPLAADFITPFGSLTNIIFYDKHGKDAANNTQLSFCPIRRQYFIAPIPGRAWPTVLFCEYIMKKIEQPTDHNVMVLEEPLLDLSTKEAMETSLQDHELMTILQNHTNLESKLDYLARYMRRIPIDAVQEVGESEDSDALFCLNLVKNKKGACRHRAMAFMLLAHYLQTPALFEQNGIHALCSVPYVGGLVMYDLGGVLSEIKDLSLAEKKAAFSRSVTASSKPIEPSDLSGVASGSGVAAELDVSREVSSALDRYLGLFRRITEKKPLENWDNINPTEPTLVLHNAAFSPLKLYTDFLATTERDKPVFYIHSPNDFMRFLQPKKLIDGYITEIDGPLKDYIKYAAPLILIVNGNSFNDLQLVTYKSIADDTTPTLHEYTLPSNIQIIWLIDETRPLSDAFSSRLTTYYYSKEMMPTVSASSAVLMDVIEVDLHHRHDWENLLLYPEVEYSVLPDKTATRIIQGDNPLDKAILENKILRIINPPKDNAAFDLFYFRFMTERKTLVNGSWKDLTSSATYIELVEQTLEETAQIHILPATQVGQRRIFLSANTFYQLYQDMTYHLEGGVEQNPGLLASYQEGDVFYIQGCIPIGLWETAVKKIKQDYPDKTFCFSFAPGAMIEGMSLHQATEEAVEAAPRTFIFFSNDSFYLATQIKEEKNAQLLTVSPQTTVSELFLSMTLNTDRLRDGLTAFSTLEKILLQKLRAGEKIILHGSLSQNLYNIIRPFLRADGRYFLNGRFETFSGSLILVMPEKTKDHLLLHGEPSESILFNWDDYASSIEDIDRENFSRLRAFYEKSCCLPIFNRELNQTLEWTSHKIQHALTWMRDQPDFHANNPIKSLLLYEFQKDSAEYAFLNVLGKYYLSSIDTSLQVNEEKLLSLIKDEYGCDPYSCFDKIPLAQPDFLFKLLNCFNAEMVRAILGNIEHTVVTTPTAFPCFTDKAKAELFYSIERIMQHSARIVVASAKENKQQRQLETLLDQGEKLITLMGDEGSGKSHLIREVLSKKIENYICFELSQYHDWLNYRGDKKALLLIDEFNLLPDEHWHQFQCLIEDPASYPQQVVVATGNAPHFPLRHRQSLFQQTAHTIWFNRPSPKKLRMQLMAHLQDDDDKEVTMNFIMKAFEIYNEGMPWQKISYREFENILMRFTFLKKYEENTECILMKKAVILELLFSLPSPKARAKLQELLSWEQDIQDGAFELREGFAIPAARRLLYDTLSLDLQMREEILLEGEDFSGPLKKGVLAEGASGLGKSILFEEMLKAHGYTKEGLDPQKKYYMISSDLLERMKARLEEAFHAGAVVILDELNLYPELEELLNQLMSGYDSNGIKAQKKGFFVLASQNPCTDQGRQAQSMALRSRFHHVYIDNYEESELRALLDYYRIKNKGSFLKAWQDTGGHTRTFFRAIKEEKSSMLLASGLS